MSRFRFVASFGLIGIAATGVQCSGKTSVGTMFGPEGGTPGVSSGSTGAMGSSGTGIGVATTGSTTGPVDASIDVALGASGTASNEAGFGDTDASSGVAEGGVVGPSASFGVCEGGAALVGATGWVVFDSDVVGLVRHIFAVHVDDCTVTQLTSGASVEQEPAVSADGQTLVFSSNRSQDGSFQLYAMNMASRTIAQLTTQTGGAGQPAFSPDGTLIAYHSGYAIYVMSAGGSTPHEIIVDATPQFGTNYEHPVFTLDGQNLIVDRLNEIDEFDLQGQNERSVVGNWTADELYPALSANGTNVAYVSACALSSLQDSSIMLAELGDLLADPCAGRPWNSAVWGALSHPSWGAGTLLAFTHQTAGGLHRVAISNSDQQVVDLVADDGDQQDSVWAPATFKPN